MRSDDERTPSHGAVSLPDGALDWVRQTVGEEGYPAPLRNAVGARAATGVWTWIPRQAATDLATRFRHDTDVPLDMWSCGVDGLTNLMGLLQSDLSGDRQVSLAIEETADFTGPYLGGGRVIDGCTYFVCRGADRQAVESTLGEIWMPIAAVGVVTSGVAPGREADRLTEGILEEYVRYATHGVLFPWDGQGIAVVGLDPPLD